MKQIQKSLLIASVLTVGASATSLSTIVNETVQAQDVRLNAGLSALPNTTISITVANAQLYDQDGQILTGRTLNFQTDWKVDYQNTLASGSYYRVATNEFVKASDVKVLINTPGIAENNDQGMGQIVLRDYALTITSPQAQVYDMNGNPMSRALTKDTSWKVGMQNNLPSGTYYSVSTNEFVKASDIYLYQNTQTPTVKPNVNTVTVHTNTPAQVYDQNGQAITGYGLAPNSAWITDNYIIIDKVGYYRVANNEYVCVTDVTAN